MLRVTFSCDSKRRSLAVSIKYKNIHMADDPKISVIMGVYNCESTVAEAIESILGQSFTDFEFVICDDCSVDNTYQIICDYAERDSDRVVVLRNEKNSKLAYSLNHCLRHARGKYIARMDGDDLSVSDRLQKLYEFLEANPGYDLVGSAVSFFDGAGIWGTNEKREHPNKRDKLGGVCFNHASIMMKRATYEKLGGYTDVPRTVRCEDLDLWYKFFAAGCKGYNLKEDLYHVRLAYNDMKRRKFEDRLNSIKTCIVGYKSLGFRWIEYGFLIKALIAAILPNRIMFTYHKLVLRQRLR